MLRNALKNLSWREYLKITFGTLLVAIGLDFFLVPNKIAAGGVAGIATILHHLFALPVGASALLMNGVLFVVAFYILGGGFGIKSIFATVLLSFFIDLIHFFFPLAVFTEDLLIAAIFGNLLTGIGMAVVFNQDASTGGTDILARIVNKYSAMDIGKALLIFDFAIAASAGVFLRSMSVALYSLFSVLVNTRTIDEFIGTMNNKKSVMIITQYPDKILDHILHKLNRGATVFKAMGAYEKTDRQVILTIVNRRQIVKVRNIVRNVDPDGFVVIGSVSEVLGEGFRQNVA